eukprot:3566483-Rhodomonas_salina.3
MLAALAESDLACAEWGRGSASEEWGGVSSSPGPSEQGRAGCGDVSEAQCRSEVMCGVGVVLGVRLEAFRCLARARKAVGFQNDTSTHLRGHLEAAPYTRTS